MQSNDTTGNRTPDLPVCNAVPQPTAPPRSAKFEEGLIEKVIPDTHEIGERVNDSDGYNVMKRENFVCAENRVTIPSTSIP